MKVKIFLETGVWINVFSVVSWVTLVEQAKAEEVNLEGAHKTLHPPLTLT